VINPIYLGVVSANFMGIDLYFIRIIPPPTRKIEEGVLQSPDFTHGKKGLVTPTKSFVKIRITKIFRYDNKMFSSINKTFGCCSNIFG